MTAISEIIDEEQISRILQTTKKPAVSKVMQVLHKAEKKTGLSLDEVGCLLNTEDEAVIKRMFRTAAKIKKEIYGNRLVFFAPLYVSNFCINDCEYCGFHRSNPAKRKKLSLDEIREQVTALIRMGHKRLLLEAGEHSDKNSIEYMTAVIRTIYNTKFGNGEIRRINVNIAATSIENYKKLKAAGIGTYQLFQETYHRETYEKLHHGPKADYERQLFAHNRAFKAGLDDVGLGVLFGLYDYKFDVLGLVSHAQYLDKKFGVGPHTISVPRWQPATTVSWNQAPRPVSDDELLKIIAILRLAVPYTGMIISTREKPELRAKAFKIGISQTSAASRTSPGGYGKKDQDCFLASQFVLADTRPADEVLKSVLKQGLLPSFCTACYRKGRTGKVFMEFAKPGDIQNLCLPNALLTFKEYMEDYASEEVQLLADKKIKASLKQICDRKLRQETKSRLERIESGERDLYF